MGERMHWVWPPAGAPLYTQKGQSQRDDRWSQFDSSVNSVSFGFVATAILISMFLFMAVFERFFRRPTSPASSPSGRPYGGDHEPQMGFNGKLRLPSPNASVNAREVSVLMPGENIPTFIAHPAPVPCHPEHISWPTHQHESLPNISRDYNSITSSSSI